MPMQNRGFSVAGKYRYACPTESFRRGFNGKEKDNDLAADNYDFGARIYDARIGRWMAVDAKYFESPGHSTYKVNYNNPIIYLDPDGNQEILSIYVTINGKRTLYKKMKVSDRYYYEQGYDTDGDKIDRYYDIYHTLNINIDANGRTFTTTSEVSRNSIDIVAPWGSEFAANVYRSCNEWTSERGGFELVSENGLLTRKKASANTDKRSSLNVDNLMAAFGALGKTADAHVLVEFANICKDLITFDWESLDMPKSTNKCTVNVCPNTNCDKSSEEKVKANPKIDHSDLPGRQWHGNGREIEVDCPNKEK